MVRALIPAVAAASLLAAARPARACGGFFCNPLRDPQALPDVVQAGENVVFAIDRDPVSGEPRLEAHIQILYQGSADKFSWVIPTLTLPTLDVGINRLFQVLEPGTRPTFDLRTEIEGECAGSGGAGCGGDSTPSRGVGGSGRGPDDAGGGDGGVDVAFRGDVGPFGAAVIQSTDPMELKRWLASNGYFVSADAARIIDTYVLEGSYFVALKLLPGRDVNEIQPIVLRMSGDAACVPLRLTAIASVEDLRVNVWVLGSSRAVPMNYLEVEVNQARIDWLKGGANYPDLLKQAADEAGGNAFATEFAGDVRFMDGTLWRSQQFDIRALAARVTPPAFVAEMRAQGFPQDGQVQALLRRHIPLPARVAALGVTEAQFYAKLDEFWALFEPDFAPFDPAAFAADLDGAIVTPLRNAQAMFDRHTTVTRMATFISPAEMTKDPMFILNTSLPPVSNRLTATAHLMCGDRHYADCRAPLRVDMPGGGSLWLRPEKIGECGTFTSTVYARGDVDALPAARAAWARGADGEGVAMVDNRRMVDDAIRRHNDRVEGVAPPLDTYNPVGCGCALPGATGPAGTILLLLAAAALRRRRR